ncbi:MoaD/ThiS family protein [Nocardioides sp. TRM66260-LWL]|uniref:MoaD/ThiS family protein n=1 Tax=Nocardioides sp. TRM66260-LWL TaxID=2874478 RepID=UPI001CC4DC18|nr:MoaD/ThiS family protein [Nocardioides sp. TRM66260-LWL]MBZ5734884.1 MoaD/ThiS family protein [Nocardioides sp. TRM66260-LWL]
MTLEGSNGFETEFIRIRYWAAAKAAAGVAEERLEVSGPVTLAEVRRRVVEGRPALASVLAVCSVLVDDEPAGSRDPAEVGVAPGRSVEFLPPFAGG